MMFCKMLMISMLSISLVSGQRRDGPGQIEVHVCQQSIRNAQRAARVADQFAAIERQREDLKARFPDQEIPDIPEIREMLENSFIGDLNNTEKMYMVCDEIVRDLARENLTVFLSGNPVDEWFLEAADHLAQQNTDKCKIGFGHQLSCNDERIKDDYKERFNGLCEKSLDALNEINKGLLVTVPELYTCSETDGAIAVTVCLGLLALLAAVGVILAIVFMMRRGRKTKGEVQGEKSEDAENQGSLDEGAPKAAHDETPAAAEEEAPEARNEESPAPAQDEEAPAPANEEEGPVIVY